MKKYSNYIIITLLLLSFNLFAQMPNGTDTLYGNEWIDYSKDYYKIQVAENGICRVSKSDLDAAGFPTSTAALSSLQLFNKGEEVALFTTTSNTMNSSDYFEFYCERNKGDIDKYLIRNYNGVQLNEDFSMFSDTSSYFLTITPGTSNKRFVETTNDLTNLPSKEQYYIEEVWDYEKTSLNSFLPPIPPNNLYKSEFSEEHGFTSRFNTWKTYTHNLTVDNIATFASENLTLTSKRISRGTGTKAMRFFWNNELIGQKNHSAFEPIELTTTISKAKLTEGTNQITVSNTYSSTGKIQNQIPRVFDYYSYPRLFKFNNLNQKTFKIKGSTSKQYFEIENFNGEGTSPILYDVTNQLRIKTTVSGNQVKFTLPQSNTERTLVLISDNQSNKILPIKITKKKYSNPANNVGDYIIISTQRVAFDNNGVDQIQAYKDYRNSTGYQAAYYEIEDLYDQFAYGIWKHNITLRNFAHYAHKNWSLTPTHLFIIGKGRNFIDSRIYNEGVYNTDFVMTYSEPEADNILTSISSNTNEQLTAVGRLPVVNGEQIKEYLLKVQEFESFQPNGTLENDGWRKQSIHLSGGDPNIQNTINTKMNYYAELSENSTWGAEVSKFSKVSSAPILQSESAELVELVNEGKSLITFFGHSSSSGWDYSVDNVSTWTNKGKYPVVLSLGCYAGNIHSANNNSISEQMVFAKDKGAIAFLGSNTLSTIPGLDIFAKEFYENYSNTMYGKSLGEILQNTIKNTTNISSIYSEMVIQQVTLNGDPGIRIHDILTPDYTIDESSVTFTPNQLSTDLESVELNFDVLNLGQFINDSITITIEQTYPNGDQQIVDTIRVLSPKYNQNITMSFSLDKLFSPGNNNFTITLDSNDEIDEQPNLVAENNNTYTIDKFITTDEISLINPCNYSIVNNDFELITNTSTFNKNATNYIIEIDTTKNFNSTLFESHQFTSSGGVYKFSPSIEKINNTVYYWRASEQQNQNWKHASFTYIDNSKNGWNQQHYQQYKENELQTIQIDENSQSLQFITDFLQVQVESQPNKGKWYGFTTINFKLVNKFWKCSKGKNGIYITVIDPITGEASMHHTNTNASLQLGSYGAIHCRGGNKEYGFLFNTESEVGRNNAIDFIENIVNDGQFLVIQSLNNYQPQLWANDSINRPDNKNLFNVLEAYGSSKIRNTLNNPVQFSLLCSKNNTSFTSKEQYNNDLITNEIHNYQLPGSWFEGTMTSSIIGPAKSWDKFKWDNYANDSEAYNDYNVTITALKEDGSEYNLYVGESLDSLDLSSLDATVYPNIKLALYEKDEIQKTPQQLTNWTVFYEGLPDLAVAPNLHLTTNKDTLEEGEIYSISMAIENLSSSNLDSVLVSYNVRDKNNNETIYYKRFKPINGNDTIHVNFDISTAKLLDANLLTIVVNPNQDQGEKLTSNNTYLRTFYVENDTRNPSLDVTFDGKHIIDGDIISSNPNIIISLFDDNQYLALNDTSLFKISIAQLANDSIYVPISFDNSNEQVVFYPSTQTGANNKAFVEINPSQLVPGDYEFFVSAIDASGNSSGDFGYKVRFTVSDKNEISNFYNYPNPFSTSTQFVYTLTGSVQPDDVKIQIWTVSGKLAKTITSDELGPLKFGTNLTDYRWDGTDDYGDKLANGVYLYRVVASSNGKAIDKMKTGGDDFFDKGFGKLVILR